MKKKAVSKISKPMPAQQTQQIPTLNVQPKPVVLQQQQSLPNQVQQVQQQIQQIPLQVQRRQQQEETPVQNFSDDEALVGKKEQTQAKLESVKQKPLAELEKSIQISLQSLTKAIKLSSQETQTLPIQAQIKTLEDVNSDNGLNNRPSVDLICVIDVSGSMGGQKIDLVKYTLKQLGDFLNENDRVSLITFESQAYRIVPLRCFNEKNKADINQKIQGLKAGGGTDITKGMNLALKTIKERKFKNDVTSVFLLSDGQDPAGKPGVQNLLKQYQIQDPFTINCYGFGNDHDPELMNGIAHLGDGGFYFVEVLDQVDEMFVDALGGLFSVLAQKVQLTVKLDQNHKHFQKVLISKTYGDQWKLNGNKEHCVSLQQLISGVSKEFVFEIQIPPMSIQLMDYERNADFLQLEFEAEIDSQKIRKTAQLQLTIYNENEVIVPEINEEVEINVIRIQAADNMNQARIEAEKGNLESGQKMMDQIEKKIKNLKPSQQQQLKMLENDIAVCKTALSSRQQYEKVGKAQIIASTKVQMEKRSKVAKFDDDFQDQGVDQFSFQNSVQQKMVSLQKSKKKM